MTLNTERPSWRQVARCNQGTSPASCLAHGQFRHFHVDELGCCPGRRNVNCWGTCQSRFTWSRPFRHLPPQALNSHWSIQLNFIELLFQTHTEVQRLSLRKNSTAACLNHRNDLILKEATIGGASVTEGCQNILIPGSVEQTVKIQRFSLVHSCSIIRRLVCTVLESPVSSTLLLTCSHFHK